jgi:hypothetical protein
MKNNLKTALILITTLSLLLGLSLGQIHRQYRQIQVLQQQSQAFDLEPIYIEIPEWRQNCRNAIDQELEASRAEIEAAKEMMRMEREAQLRELREQVERVREMWHR